MESGVECADVVHGDYFMGGMMVINGLMALVLLLSGLFHSFLRRLGQPSIISHILAGVVVGPTFLGRAVDLRRLGMQNAGSALGDTIYYLRIIFMFFLGLEMDLRYLRHNLRRSLLLACGGSAISFLLAVAAGPFFYGMLHPSFAATFHPQKLYASTALFILVVASIVNTFMAGPASAAIVRQQRRAFKYRSHCLQELRLEQELRVLVCVHGAGGVQAMLTLAELSKGSSAPVAVYLLHLVELQTARKYAITHLYNNQSLDSKEEEEEDARWGYSWEMEQVTAAVHAFSTYDAAVPVPVRQMTAISSLASMDEDVRNGVEDARASLVIVPFHKEQRYDGRMVSRRGGDGRRQLNQRILQRARCTVGILVERRLPSIPARPRPRGGERPCFGAARRRSDAPGGGGVPERCGRPGGGGVRDAAVGAPVGERVGVPVHAAGGVADEDEDVGGGGGGRGVHGGGARAVRVAGAGDVHGAVREQRGGDAGVAKLDGGGVLAVRGGAGWRRGRRRGGEEHDDSGHGGAGGGGGGVPGAGRHRGGAGVGRLLGVLRVGAGAAAAQAAPEDEDLEAEAAAVALPVPARRRPRLALPRRRRRHLRLEL
uniref:Uncharacterized protein n=1 Tax=Aegilops tauschii subsp. strangulata TaxID=200361 RepID=A0A453Q8X9_AEGTS